MGENVYLLFAVDDGCQVYLESNLPAWATDQFKVFIESDPPLGIVADNGHETCLVRIGPDSARAAGLVV